MGLDRHGDRGRPVCVLGFGRSGTSLAARAVNALGVDLGPVGSMLPPDNLNPSGYWEQREIVALNDAILAALGGEWWRPPSRPPGWETASAMDPFRERIEALAASFGGRRWGFKDPRAVFTLPLWRSAVGEFDHVVCLRDPLEVFASSSAAAAMGVPWPPGVDLAMLWLHYGCEALRLTAGARRTFVFYDQWTADPTLVAASLARIVGGVADTGAAEHVGSLFRPDLHRQRAADRPPDARGGIPVAARALWALARDLAAAEERDDEARARELQERASSLDQALFARVQA